MARYCGIEASFAAAISLRAVLIGTAAVAASITLLLVLNPFSSGQADGFSKVEQAFAGLSQEDQDYMLEVYQEDIFINR